MTDDGAFRVVAARMTDTVEQALSAQDAWGDNGRYLGELLIGACWCARRWRRRTACRGCFARAIGAASSSPTRTPTAARAACSRARTACRTSSLEGGTLEMMRTLYNGEVHRGVVRIPDRRRPVAKR